MKNFPSTFSTPTSANWPIKGHNIYFAYFTPTPRIVCCFESILALLVLGLCQMFFFYFVFFRNDMMMLFCKICFQHFSYSKINMLETQLFGYTLSYFNFVQTGRTTAGQKRSACFISRWVACGGTILQC